MSSKFGFCVVKVVDAYLNNKKKILPGDEMDRIVLGDWKPNSITLVFTLWSYDWLTGNNTNHSSLCTKAQEVGLCMGQTISQLSYGDVG